MGRVKAQTSRGGDVSNPHKNGASPQFLRKGEYAKRVGTTAAMVSKWIRKGIVTPTPDGLIDVELADVQIKANRDPSRAHLRKATIPSAPRDVDNSKRYHSARTERAEYQAKLARLEYDERAGVLIAADAVRSRIFVAARTTRDALQAIPDRVAPLVRAEKSVNKIKALLKAEIELALSTVSEKELEREFGALGAGEG